MRLPAVLDQCELGTELGSEGDDVIAAHRETAAPLRTVFGKGCHDGSAAGFQRGLQHLYVSAAVLSLGQEVKYRAIMPKVVLMRRPPLRDVADLPVDSFRIEPEAFTGRCQSGVRYVQNGDFEAAFDQLVDEA